MRVRWLLYGFIPGLDAVEMEVDADGLDAGFVRELLGAPIDDPLYDSYPLEAVQREQVERFLNVNLAADLDWCIEAVRVGS